MNFCPCGSLQNYSACCRLYLDKALLPKSPEQLMRSRYTAFTLENWDYIKNTMRGIALQTFIEPEKSESKIQWLGLEILNCAQEKATGHVEFIAKYLKNNKLQSIHEKSEFRLEDGKWYYIDSLHFPTKKYSLSQNNPCPCGSHKKFKNCHG